MATLQNASKSSHDLDSPDYDPLDHLNKIFSHASVLSSAPKVSSALSLHQDELDISISERIAQQTASNAASIQRLKDAQKELAELFGRIETVQKRALETEQSITVMTADIKKLDHTKRNLTLSMTALKRLQMLTTAYEQLRTLGKTRQYRECGQLLGAVVQLMAHFKSYRSIDQIAVLSRKVSDVQRELLEQVCEDFENAWQKNEVTQRRGTLHEACVVIDALGDGARARLAMWYCNITLREYRQIFRGNEEAGSLDNISRRFAWFNRIMKTYEAEHAAVFPQHWHVNEALANAFCESTKEDFSGILQKSARRADGQTIDVNLLLSCLQETLDFEHTLERRFVADSRQSFDTVSSIASSNDKRQIFTAAISSAFEPYLGLWVEAQDRTLSQMIPRYRSTPIRNVDDEFTAELVMPSSTELFQSYRVCLAQCAKLSTGEQLCELSKLFSKYLDQYSQDVLFHNLADRGGSQGPSIEDAIVILNTADYCYSTTSQLEEKIKARIDPSFADAIDLEPQAEAFLGVAGAAVRALVHNVEQKCEAAWREMRNIPWAKMEGVGDQSSYVSYLVNSIREQSKRILEILKKQQYARAFCDNLVDALTTTYINNVVACRPVSEVGAEQLLLDSYVVKNALIGLPVLVANGQSSSASLNYSKRVTQTTARIDSLLKTIQVRPSPPEALVQAYLLHIGDRSESNFKKILDLKGITARREQAPLIELFNAHKSASHHSQLPSAGIILTHLNFASPVAGSHTSTPSLSTPASAAGSVVGGAATSFGSNVAAATGGFGNALLNAAKDGALSLSNASSVAPSRVASPPSTGSGAQAAFGQGQVMPQMETTTAPSADLSGNLKNIGRFFKRDMGNAFGRFGTA